MRTLRYGSRGKDVSELQKLLNARLKPSPDLQLTGVFLKKTDKAVRRFQDLAGIGVDGVVGPLTFKALLARDVKSDAKAKPGIAPTGEGTLVTASSDGKEAAWMKVAESEIGQKEVNGKQHNPRIIEYHATTTLNAKADETAWCSSFVNWCLKQVGLPGTGSAAAISWKSWGEALTTARKGAVVVIHNAAAANSSLSVSGNHVGFLVEETKKHYVILGGNQANQVKVSSFPKSGWSLKAYRWPQGK